MRINKLKILFVIFYSFLFSVVGLYLLTMCYGITSSHSCRSYEKQNQNLGWPLKFAPLATIEDEESGELFMYGYRKLAEGRINLVNLFIDSQIIGWGTIYGLMSIFYLFKWLGIKYSKIMSKKIF